MLSTFLLSSAYFISISKAFYAWEVLSADLTCCPQYSGDQFSCENEIGSDCYFVAETETNEFYVALAAEFGNCLGMAFVECKEQEGVEGCCAPGCADKEDSSSTGGDPADPINKPGPICEQAVPTPKPTPFPTKPLCEMGTGYTFSGYPCQISGDPHVKMTNGDKHDFQGQPLKKYKGNGKDDEYLNSFYYVSRCADSDESDMPFQILGTHFHWGDRVVSGVDYLTIELNARGGDVYFLYFSSYIAGYAMKGKGVTKDYDATDKSKVTDLTSGVTEYVAGRFQVTYYQKSEGKADIKIKIDGDDTATYNDGEVYIYMAGQMDKIYDEQGKIAPRQRMHYIYIKQSDIYKCSSCGLCGNYKSDKKGEMEGCDGRYNEFRGGFNYDKTPEAFDIAGWTYEYYYFNNHCGEDYDMTDNGDNLEYVNPCPQEIAKIVSDKCQAAMHQKENTKCCDIIGKETCTQIRDDCTMDVCITAAGKGATKENQKPIDDDIKALLTEQLAGICSLPGAKEDLEPGKMIPAVYKGCYVDTSDRACPHELSKKVTNFDLAWCIQGCYEKGYKYVGAQYAKECWCSKTLTEATRYGEITGQDVDKKCTKGMDHLQGDGVSKFGCFGGDWANCVYEITKEKEPMDKVFMSRIVEEDKEQGTVRFAVLENTVNAPIKDHYTEMAVVGGVVLLFGAAMLYKSRTNKDSKYLPIKEPVQV